MQRSPGIDDLNVYGSSLSIDFQTIAAARGYSDKELDAVQFRRRSVTPPYEDPVTLAVNAARPLVAACGPQEFDLLVVATESGVDYGKPLSAYIHQHLGLASRCRNFDVKYACYGGTAAVQLAVAWIRGEAALRRKALVVMTDLARRHFTDAAELSAGSGAVAVVVAPDPRVLEISGPGGYCCREIYDVARPTAVDEWGDPVLSIAAYLDMLEGAWDDYCCRTESTAPVDQRFRYMLYHTPLVSLVRQAHEVLLQASYRESEPPAAGESFERMVAPSLCYAREMANIYSGSVYGLLAALVEHAPDLPSDTPLGIFSYGSGSCSELYAGRVPGPARPTVARHAIGVHLARRRALDILEYEALVRQADLMLTSRNYDPPDEWPVDGSPGHADARLVLRRVRNHHRQYEWVS